MQSEDSIRHRLENVICRVDNLYNNDPVSFELPEIRQCISEVQRLFRERSCKRGSGEDTSHPFGHKPHLTSRILFNLDRCEELLDSLESNQQEIYEKSRDPESLLYPSVADTIWRRIFAILLYFRGCITKCAVDYNQPTLREILYLKSPFWLDPLIRKILPRKRPRWSHYPKADATDN